LDFGLCDGGDFECWVVDVHDGFEEECTVNFFVNANEGLFSFSLERADLGRFIKKKN
jgi:hypothetical protein